MRNIVPRKDSNRVEKLNSLIQQLIGMIIMPYLKSTSGLTTVSKVQCSRDLKWAKVWITVLNGDDDAVLNTLHNNLYDIQGELNRQLDMKVVPRITFYLDTTTRHADHISHIFQEIQKEREESGANEDQEKSKE